MGGPNMQKKKPQLFLYSTHVKKLRDGCDVHEAFHQNCEVHSPWVWGSGPSVGALWSDNEHALNLRKSSSIFPYTLYI